MVGTMAVNTRPRLAKSRPISGSTSNTGSAWMGSTAPKSVTISRKMPP